MSITINGTCKDCAHWKLPPIVQDDGYGDCTSDKIAIDRSRYDENGDPALIPADGAWGYDDHLNTGPEFACIHWMSKPCP